MKSIILGLTLLTVGLIAGLFYSWSISVMLGMKKLPDREFILSMQSMNKAIQNPMFFSCFFGAIILLCLTCFQQYSKPFDVKFGLILGATLLYFFGIIVVTIIGNVPLNNMLDNFDLTNSSIDKISEIRNQFENKWNVLNNFRTFCGILSFILLIVRAILVIK